MPQIGDLVKKRKFVKKNYRAWNLSGENASEKEEDKAYTQETPEAVDLAPDDHPAVNEKPKSEKTAIVEEVKEQQAIKVATKPETYPESLENIQGNDNGTFKGTIKEHQRNAELTQENSKEQIVEQQGNKLRNDLGNNNAEEQGAETLVLSIKKLHGIQRKIFFHVFNLCNARGALDTGVIMTPELAEIAGCTIGSTHTSIKRLIKKNLLMRKSGQKGHGGYIVLGITDETRTAAIQAQKIISYQNSYHSENQYLRNNQGNNIRNNAPYSSSNKNINTTTKELPEEWQNIKFETLADIGFTSSQIKQIYNTGNSTPEIVQDSINRFAYSLEYNEKIKNHDNPLNIFMGVLRKGNMWNEPNYVPPKELALRQLVEEKRKQKEKQQAMIQELIDLEYPDWKKELSKDERNAILTEDTKKTKLTGAIEAELKRYFVDNVLMPRLEKEGLI